MFSTISVNAKILNSEQSVNDYGEPQSVYSDVVIDGCLISPASSTDALFPQLFSDKNVKRIDIPKTFTADLGNSIFLIDGKSYRTVGDPSAYMVENTPGQWNRFVLAQEDDSL